MACKSNCLSIPKILCHYSIIQYILNTQLKKWEWMIRDAYLQLIQFAPVMSTIVVWIYVRDLKWFTQSNAAPEEERKEIEEVKVVAYYKWRIFETRERITISCVHWVRKVSIRFCSIIL